MNENNQTPRNEYSPNESPETKIPEAPAAEAPAPEAPAPEMPQQPYGAVYGNSYTPYGQPTPPPQKPKKNRLGLWIGLGVAAYLLLMVGVVAIITGGAINFANEEAAAETESAEKATEEATEEDKKTEEKNPALKENNADEDARAMSAAEVYEKNVESVVFVEAIYPRGKSTGSGFVIDGENGYIMTNFHVVEECDDIAVTFSDGDSYTAKLIGGDNINDVAVLQIEPKDRKNVTVGDSDKLRIGDDVLVIGNPLGDLTFTLTRGIVSGTDREINTGEHAINTFQTDAAINSGNSGGPAFDATGAVIGIASAKYAATGVEGIGFCIPINDAMEIARDLVEHGYVTGRPNFGITVSDSTGYEYTTDEWGRRVIVETMPGARIEEVGKDSCAEKAGLKAGDIVIKLNDTKIETANELINAKNKCKAGDTVTLEIYRDGKTLTLDVTLDEYTPE